MSAERTIDQLFTELKQICDTLEKGKVSLEKSLVLYAKGLELETQLNAKLQSAERRVVEIINADGSIEPFEIPAKR